MTPMEANTMRMLCAFNLGTAALYSRNSVREMAKTLSQLVFNCDECDPDSAIGAPMGVSEATETRRRDAMHMKLSCARITAFVTPWCFSWFCDRLQTSVLVECFDTCDRPSLLTL